MLSTSSSYVASRVVADSADLIYLIFDLIRLMGYEYMYAGFRQFQVRIFLDLFGLAALRCRCR